MRTIYEPKGKAREYSPLAVNFYKGCDHGCVYCYAPGIQRSSREEYLNVKPREGLLEALERDAEKWAGTDKQVLFNFMGDPYCKANDDYKITREALKIMLAHRIPQTKYNLKTYGKNVMHHEYNLAAVCSLRCNSAVLLSPATHPIEAKALIGRIQDDLKGKVK